MATALSKDLRKRIVAAHKAGEGTYLELSKRFKVGEASISRLLRRFRETGGVEPAGHGGGQRPKIGPEQFDELRKLVEETPDRTIQQLCHAWAARTGTRISLPAMHRTLHKAGLTWKKNGSVRPSSSAKTSKRAALRISKK